MARNIVEIILKGTDKTKGAFKSAESGSKGLESSIGKLAAQLGVAALAGAAFKKGLDFAKESTLLAARVETLGVVTEVMGRNAGKTSAEVRQLEESIKAQGITTQAARQSLAQMMRANIDLARSTDLARLAQDAAVISGENSSQAFEKLTLIIGTGNTLMARRMGLLVDFEGAYKKLATQLGKSTNDLTQLEKVQARTNEVMEQGVTITGAYDAAMETAGKKLSSYPRYLEELKLAFGEMFQEGFVDAIDIVTDFTDALTDTVKVNNMLTDAYKKGNMTRADVIKLKLEILATDKTMADAVDELIEKEKQYAVVKYELKDAIDAAKDAGVDYHDVTTGVYLGTMDLSEGTIILNERLAENERAVELSTEGMRQYAEWMEAGTIWTFRGEEALTRYGAAQAVASGRAKEGSKAAQMARKAQQEYNAQLGKTKNLLGGVNTGLRSTIDTYKEQIAWIAAGGQNLVAQAEKIMEAYGAGLIDSDTATEALKIIQEGAIDVDMELGKITTEEAVNELVEMGYPIDEAKAKVEELQNTLFAMTGRNYQIDVLINYGGGGPPKTGGSGGASSGEGAAPAHDWTQHGTGGWKTVPSGYSEPGNPYMVAMSSGEKYNVVEKGGNSGGGMTNNIVINSNQDPQEIANEVIRELQFRMN